MIDQVTDAAFVQRQLDLVRSAVADGQLDDVLHANGSDRATALSSLPLAQVGMGSSGTGSSPFMSREPLVALLQTAIEDRLHTEHAGIVQFPTATKLGELSATPSVATTLTSDQFTNHDPRWVTEIAKAAFARVLRGTHPFNPTPATHAISSDARIVVVGDWGSGLPRARAVGAHMASAVEAALAEGRETHVVHLGDVYYSGDAGEYDRRLLAPGLWPVTKAQAAGGVSSWSLNGNHDMYAGGWAYFDHLLAEPRFFAQRSPDGKGTSFFQLRSDHWNIVGLDTAWETTPLSRGNSGVLADPQGAFVSAVADEGEQSGRKLMLMSHHQPITAYDPGDLGTVLPIKLAGVLHTGRIAAWFWGHEHRCVWYEDVAGIRHPRCLGHGGVPLAAEPQSAPLRKGTTWAERDYLDAGGTHWARFGFAILDFDGPELHVTYVNDLGDTVNAETIS